MNEKNIDFLDKNNLLSRILTAFFNKREISNYTSEILKNIKIDNEISGLTPSFSFSQVMPFQIITFKNPNSENIQINMGIPWAAKIAKEIFANLKRNLEIMPIELKFIFKILFEYYKNHSNPEAPEEIQNRKIISYILHNF